MATLDPQEYDKDFYSWAMHTADLLRQGKFAEVDVGNLAEEIESMGKSDKRQLINRLAILIAHLLKWQYQKEFRGNSWKYTIKEQRFKLLDLLEDSPSLKYELESKLAHAYEQSVVIAARQTGLEEKNFPPTCPFTLEQCLDQQFLPSGY